MTIDEFKALKALQDHRVRMVFADGQEVVATLFSITIDLDGSRHVFYDEVESSKFPHIGSGNEAFYSAGEELILCHEFS